MYRYGAYSKSLLATCDPRLQLICNKAILIMDIKIFCGERGEEEQNEAYRLKRSKLKYPLSLHNTTLQRPLSLAVDAGPYPVDWDTDREVLEKFAKAMKDGVINTLEKAEIEQALNSLKRWYSYGAVIKAIAAQEGIKIRWGGDWDGDWDFTDQNFNDLPHVEIMED